ncbi:hypothetical protein B0H17DRAFT_1332027, partial [Mycena rosella]
CCAAAPPRRDAFRTVILRLFAFRSALPSISLVHCFPTRPPCQSFLPSWSPIPPRPSPHFLPSSPFIPLLLPPYTSQHSPRTHPSHPLPSPRPRPPDPSRTRTRASLTPALHTETNLNESQSLT